MRKKLLLVFVFILSLSVFGCNGSSGGSNNDPGAGDETSVYAFDTTYAGIRFRTDNVSEMLMYNSNNYGKINSLATSGEDVYAVGEGALWVNGVLDTNIEAALAEHNVNSLYLLSVAASEDKVYITGTSGNRALLIEIKGVEITFFDLPTEISESGQSSVRSVVAGADGKVYAAGTYYVNMFDPRAFLVEIDGNSTTLLNIHDELSGALTSRGYAVTVASDGSVYMAGGYDDGSNKAFLLKRNGGAFSQLTLPAELAGLTTINAMTAGNGKIYLTGSDSTATAFLAEINSSDTVSMIILPAAITGSGISSGNSVAVGNDGTVYAAIDNSGGNQAALVTVTGGTAAFTDIHSLFTGAAYSHANAAAADSSGKVHIAGYHHDNFSSTAYLLEVSSGTPASVALEVPDNALANTYAYTMAVADNGTVYMGIGYSDYSTSSAKAAIIRKSGSETELIDFSGQLTDATDIYIRSLAVGDDGRVYAAAYYYDSSYDTKAFVAEIDGSTAAIIDIHSEITGAATSAAHSVTLDSDGKIYTAGQYDDGSNKAFIAEIDNGTVTVTDLHSEFTGATFSRVNVIVAGTDGKIYAAGYYRDSSNTTRAFLMEINGGAVTVFDLHDEIAGAESSVVYSVAVGKNGKVYVTGDCYDGSNDKIFIAELSGGTLSLLTQPDEITGTDEAYTSSINVSADGKIYVGGTYYNGSIYQPYLIEINGGTAQMAELNPPASPNDFVDIITWDGSGDMYLMYVSF
ncbi:hypothetical protein EP073_09905 [Geovibrio thiophilus]|uniref:Cell surface protein n=1 Tax=Geovibrio thiophilus TaxID=139438 RepID=A0A410K008_9BACT|nr:hypothetical protein [Geovibrio thiophilus]QAR33703.1 hypothetical protein EP073_09905 [Geovibrio thiophilus]